jgi:catechol 2,3-dioxygenase-like lactoylglutathione lyase family enzyme
MVTSADGVELYSMYARIRDSRGCHYNRHVILGIDHVQLAAPAGCEEKARWFFCEVLGMRELPKPTELAKRGGCWFQCGSHQLHIGVESDFKPAKKAHPAFAVSGLDELKRRLSANGIRFEDDHTNAAVHRFYVNDPWGNRLEFVEKPLP